MNDKVARSEQGRGGGGCAQWDLFRVRLRPSELVGVRGAHGVELDAQCSCLLLRTLQCCGRATQMMMAPADKRDQARHHLGS